jgi:S1-C subfamily serine protease
VNGSHQPLPPPSHYRPGPSAWTRWLAILLLLVAGALVWVVLRQRSGGGNERSRAKNEPAEARVVTPRGDLAEDEKSTIALFENTSRSVVHITSVKSMRSRFSMDAVDVPQGTGSGFLWDSSGHVVTNFHVTMHGDGFIVTLADGTTTCRGSVIGKAPEKDIAVIQLDDSCPDEKLIPLAVGTSSNLKVGQKVFAIGNPFGMDQTLTTGVISGLGREIESVARRPIQDVIQTDAAINPGNSGGPLLDSAGRLIGINTAIYTPGGPQGGFSVGIGFAVPVDTVNLVVPQLISKGRATRPGLGIGIVPDSKARMMGVKSGVIVNQVSKGSPAERAGMTGIQSSPTGGWALGDVIVEFDGAKVEVQADLFRALDRHKVGDTVTVTLANGSNKRKVEVTLQDLDQQ